MADYNRNVYNNRRYGRRRRKKMTRRFTREMRFALFFVFVVFLLAFAALLVKIYYLDKNDGDRYRKAALSQQSYTNTVLNYQRGAIKDRNDTTLAVSIRKYNLVLEPRTLLVDAEKKEATITAIVEHFGIERQVLEDVISKKPNSMYEHIDGLKELDTKLVEAFKKKAEENSKITGFWFEETYTRNYPLNNVACNLVGFMTSEDKGTYGVEESYNDVLSGMTGREYGYFDSNMNLQRTIKEAKDGNSVVLTIDANVQQILEQQIAKFQSDGVGAKNVSVMLMNPKNGEILAMASQNRFNLNDPQSLSEMYTEQQISAMSDEEKKTAQLEMWSNFCISYGYEPGSTFKPFTIAAAMDENIINENSTFQCNGYMNVADRKIHCSNRSGHGTLDLRHSLMQSCNAALMSIGMDLGRDKFYKYVQLYGFGQRTGIDLPGETSGLIHSLDKLNTVELATSSFGQTQTVTMVQMLSAFSSLINGGNYYQPHIVKEIQNSDGDVVETIDPVIVKKTTTADTSEKMKSFLLSTVEEGTAAPAQVKGYEIGGKTGTAEKSSRDKKNYIVSFIGCTPASDPDVAIYVVIEEPHVKDQAHSTYATEFASKIMKKVLPFLGQYASKEEKDTKKTEN
ncbi:MAG: peptidoglycan glycosyltransferase [Eubacterium sp.]|nr:peptidoglycan glycosyltransferase [Eubacterium sp.]